jgi:pimeloyl-ACP methyl ester carboxylesterase
MSQTRFEELLRNFQAQCSSQHAIADLEAFAGDLSAPLVVLVHGIGGNSRHWGDPVSLNVGETWLFNIDEEPVTENRGLGMSPSYKKEQVKSWTQFLQENRVSYINFSQAKAGGLIEFAVKELTDILSSLETSVLQPLETEGVTPPKLIIVAHSRGGLVTRAATKNLGKEKLPHLTRIITLCTPHEGSFMPRLANDYNSFLHTQMKFDIGIFRALIPLPLQPLLKDKINEIVTDLANLVRESMLRSFGTMAMSPGFDELIPNSPMLTALQENEQPLPGVEYFSFGGSQPNFVNFFLVVAGQAIKIFGTASAQLIGMLGAVPGVKDTYDGIAELVEGDSAVAIKRSRFPAAFNAPHKDFHLNHMQVLIDNNLQTEVLGLIRTQEGGATGGWDA